MSRGNSRVGVQDFERLAELAGGVSVTDHQCHHAGVGRTPESTSYTRKPELRLVNGVMDGPILSVTKGGLQHNTSQTGTLGSMLTHPTAPAVSALMTVALFA